MLSTEKRITTSQLFCLIFILGMSLKMLMLPILLLKSSGRDSIISLIIILVLEIALLGAMITSVMLSPGKTFPEIMESVIGKWASKIILSLFAVFFFAKLLLIAGEVRIFFGENLFGDFNWSLYSLPFFALCTLIGMGTARALGRLSQFLFPFILAATVIMFVLIGIGVDYSNLLPLGEGLTSHMAGDSVRYAMWYGDCSALVVFIGSVKRTRKTAGAGMLAGAFSASAVLMFMVFIVASFANVASSVRFGQNLTGMSHYALGSAMQGRFDLIIFCVWLFSVFVKAGIFSFAVVEIFCYIVPVNRNITALGMGMLLYACSMLWNSATGLHSFMINDFAMVAFTVQLIIPVLSLTFSFIAKLKTKKGKEKEHEAQ